MGTETSEAAANAATDDEVAFILEHGDAGTARLLGFPRATAARIAARLPVRRGSLMHFRARLATYRARASGAELAGAR